MPRCCVISVFSVFITIPENAGAGDHHDRGADHGAGAVDRVWSGVRTRVHETEIDQDDCGHEDHADEALPLCADTLHMNPLDHGCWTSCNRRASAAPLLLVSSWITLLRTDGLDVPFTSY